MCGIGDVVTAEALAATALLKENLPGVKIRFVNVVDLFRLVSHQDHPHGERRRIYLRTKLRANVSLKRTRRLDRQGV